MSRKKSISKQYPVKQSLYYEDDMVSKFVRMIMRHGKLATAESLLRRAMIELHGMIEKSDDTAGLPVNYTTSMGVERDLALLLHVFELIRLRKKTVSQKSHGQSFQIPQEVPLNKQAPAGMKILIQEMRRQILSKGRSGSKILAILLFDILHNKGEVLDLLRGHEAQADANRIYAQYDNRKRDRSTNVGA